ncbi:MAG: hypothetical protein ACLU38_11805 [Dysosmobacter sp.]
MCESVLAAGVHQLPSNAPSTTPPPYAAGTRPRPWPRIFPVHFLPTGASTPPDFLHGHQRGSWSAFLLRRQYRRPVAGGSGRRSAQGPVRSSCPDLADRGGGRPRGGGHRQRFWSPFACRCGRGLRPKEGGDGVRRHPHVVSRPRTDSGLWCLAKLADGMGSGEGAWQESSLTRRAAAAVF